LHILVIASTIFLRGNDMSEMVQVLVRLRPEVAEALTVCKERTRMSKSGIAENALRDFLAKHGIQVEQPKVDG